METKWIAIAIVAFFVSAFGGLAVDNYSRNQVIIACLEAAKVNHQIDCAVMAMSEHEIAQMKRRQEAEKKK
jgi:hypothetical protein